jgi:hypothetical protein
MAAIATSKKATPDHAGGRKFGATTVQTPG